jgi:hypothetical protein
LTEDVKKLILQERRRSQRVSKSFRIRIKKFVFPFSGDHPQLEGEIANLSASGILVNLAKPPGSDLKAGDMLHMDIDMGRWNDLKATDKPFDYYYQREPFSVLGKIIRFEESENQMFVGIDFIGVDEGQRAAVYRYIKKIISK